MTTPHEKLHWLAAEIGKDHRRLVVMNEGCVSARTVPGRLLTKAGGAVLGMLQAGDLTECDSGRLQSMFDLPLFEANDRFLHEAQIDPAGRPPGTEAVLHSWLLQQEGVNFVAQVHPEGCLQVLCSPAAERFADHRMFPGEVVAFGAQAVYVPYSDPGIPLAREIRSKVILSMRRNQGRTPGLVMVQNCGIYALGSTAESVLRIVLTAEKAAHVFVGASRLGGPVFLPLQQVGRLEQRTDETPRPSLIKL